MIADWVFLSALSLLTLTYLVYPMVAVLIGADKTNQPEAELVRISFLVPAHNEASVIEAKIKNFLALDYPPDWIELLIADDGSTDRTVSLVTPFLGERIRLIESSMRSGKAASMNRLVAAAKYPFLLFSDANVLLSPEAPRLLARHFTDDSVGAVTGEVRLIGSDREFSAGESLYYWMERRIQSAESQLGSVMGVDGGMYMLRRQLFQVLPIDTILDDFLVSMHVLRSNHRIVYDGTAKAIESGTPSSRQEFNRRKRIAAGAVQLLKRLNVPKWNQPVIWMLFLWHKCLRWISPILIILLFASNCLLLHQGFWFQSTFVLQLSVFSLLLATWWFPALRRTAVGAIGFYFGFSQLAMLLGLLSGLANRQSAQWEKTQRCEGDFQSLES